MVDIFDFLKRYIRRASWHAYYHGRAKHRGALRYRNSIRSDRRHIAADFKFPKAGARARKPFYVAGKDAATNTVVVAEGDENPALYKKEVKLRDVAFH